MYCIIDLETRSQCDLGKSGAWNYSKHPSTEVLVVSVWDSVSKSVRSWSPDPWDPVPPWFSELVKDCNRWVAHNYFFEHAMWSNHIAKVYSLPCPPLEQWVDTRAIVLQWSLPRSLEGASSVLGIAEKDMAGAKLMQKMCKPLPERQRKDKLYHHTPEDLKRLSEYCERDVLATKAIIDELGGIQKVEVPIFQLDKQINNRGFMIDYDFVKAGYEMARRLNKEAEARLTEITDGAVTTVNQHARIKKFAFNAGYPLAATNKDAVVETLKDPKVPERVRQVLEIRQAIGKSSVAKYERLLRTCDKDDMRIRDTLVYHKASTGRWAGQNAQPQNLPRGDIKIENVEKAVQLVKNGDIKALEQIGPPMIVLSALLRPSITVPKEYKFVLNDYSGVEARGVLWLAGEMEAVEILREGGDLYKEMAASIFHKPVSDITDEERFIGKTSVLGCGYGLGAKRFSLTNKVDIFLAEKSVQGYRSRFPGVPELWRGLEKAFRMTLKHRTQNSYKGITFFWKHKRVIACRLLSGREIHYWDPGFDSDNKITYWTVGMSGKWVRVSTWGGHLTENVIQAICSDLLRYSMLNLEKAGWKIVLTVHDEIVCEVPDKPEFNTELMGHMMTKLPPWAKGFPLAVEGGEGKRYSK